MTTEPPSATSDWTVQTVLSELRACGSEKNRVGMARFGIETTRAFGVPMSVLRPLARRIGKSEVLAKELWITGFHEARLLAVLVIRPNDLTPELAGAWLSEVNSWDLCDQLTNVFAKNEASASLVGTYATDDREFVRRAAFALIAWRALPSKKTTDTELLGYLQIIEETAHDNRNYVWKAVHWALRQIGKRSSALHAPALELAEKLKNSENASARKVGREAFRELTSSKVLDRLKKGKMPN